MRKNTFLATLAFSVLTASGAEASLIGQATTGDGAAFAEACAGTGLNLRLAPGDGFSNFYAATMTCHGGSSAAGGTVSGSANSSGSGFHGETYSNSANTTASVGILRLSSVNTDSGANVISGAVASAGFNDRVTIGGGSGSGYWVIPFAIQGMMTAADFGALGTFQIDAYKNHALIDTSNGGGAYSKFAGLNSNGTGAASADTENITYGVSNYGAGDLLTLASLAVNEIRYFVIPVTFGTSFEFGIYANAWAGELGTLPLHTTDLDFNAVTYAGGAYVIASDSSVISNLTYTSTSGFDYQHAASAAAPEPGTWALLLLGTSAMWLARRRTRHAIPVIASQTS